MSRHVAVFGAGGTSGIAWTAGVLAGLRDAGVENLGTDFAIGTSGGCLAAGYVAAGLPLDAMYVDLAKRPVGGPGQSLTAELDVATVTGALIAAVGGLRDPVEIRRAVGRAARGAEVIPADLLRRHLTAQLPFQEWPAGHFAVACVSASTGEARLLDRHSDIDVLGAFMAAYAIPMIYPVAEAGMDSFMDGGLRSNENLDLVTDFTSALVVSPRGQDCPQAFGGLMLRDEVEAHRRQGRSVAVIEPESIALDLICEHMLDNDEDSRLADLGRQQGTRAAQCLENLFH